MICTMTLPCLLMGCVSFQLPSSKTYVPIWARMVNEKQYNADLEECHWTADNLPTTANLGDSTASTLTGGTDNGAVAVINPLTLAGGAAGGLVSSLIRGYDFTGKNSIGVLVLCLDRLTTQDGSAVMADYHELGGN